MGILMIAYCVHAFCTKTLKIKKYYFKTKYQAEAFVKEYEQEEINGCCGIEKIKIDEESYF
jgi:hypothetical protein